MQERILYQATAICKVWLLDLDDLLPILSPFYSHTGRPARYQPELLRSRALMVHYRVSSITRWVQLLRSDEILAIACGFDPRDVPGIGTFYAFLRRFYPRLPRRRLRSPRANLPAACPPARNSHPSTQASGRS